MLRCLFIAVLLLFSVHSFASIEWGPKRGYRCDKLFLHAYGEMCGMESGRLGRWVDDTCPNGAGNGGLGGTNFQCSTVPVPLSQVCTPSSADFNAALCVLNGGEVAAEPQPCDPTSPAYDPVACDGNCPSGTTKVANISGGGYLCQAPLEPEEPHECSNTYLSIGNPVCQALRDQCAAQGGTYGFLDNQMYCLPPGYGNELPSCASGTWNIVNNSDGGSAFSCISSAGNGSVAGDPAVVKPDGSVTGSGQSSGGVAGEGGTAAPGQQAGGTANPGTGEGEQGTGVNTEKTDSETGETRASYGGFGCGSPPSCAGDPIQCNILRQQWEMKCQNHSFDKGSLSGVNADFASGLYGERDLSGTFSNLFVDTGGSAACPPDRSFTVRGQQQVFEWDMPCDLAGIMRPFVIFLFSYLGFRIVAGAF